MYTHARIVIRAIQIVRSPAVSPAHMFAIAIAYAYAFACAYEVGRFMKEDNQTPVTSESGGLAACGACIATAASAS